MSCDADVENLSLVIVADAPTVALMQTLFRRMLPVTILR
jgi:hypothetical protein